MNTYEKLLEYNRLEKELFEVDNTRENFTRYFDKINGKVEHSKSEYMKEIEILKREIRELRKKLEIIETEKETVKKDYTELLEKINLKIKKRCSNCGENGHNSRTCSK
tara:strand:- start:1075 stop:1398 length:324 start_codon:yes stop_codon:yes gene_type:complete